MYVSRATTGCLMGTQMCCHFLSLCGHNRPKVVFFVCFVFWTIVFAKKKSIPHRQRWKSAHLSQVQGKRWRDSGGVLVKFHPKKTRDGEGEEHRDATVIHSWMCWLLLHMDLPWNAIKITRKTILHQCCFHFMLMHFGFLSSIKWRSRQLLKPPPIILPRVFARAADV